ncbi:MAG: divergent PAP2 family protein [Aphanocapsa feldmannii 277cV]|uniref:Divergent PAP2 family protein n=2 Tax=Aphanocapsa feldmannii TaxID=192050 RepID=A0A524RKY0_9CHRO|nr:MAG: divergent PAP2 family protein [Aphanocapsa feldmannii 288cV]TGG90527.1 MAG: divergent PAP2 family protein [Aphanocapsa feldmannii 277cV]TGH25480.1 MAG: divergent PAP2 family protein [Aphanocapsa feldmannii 277cI]
MPAFAALLDNAVLAWALLACGLAQASKPMIQLLQHGRWHPAALVETGGMPSSHSALVTGAATGIGLQNGFDDPLFAAACTLAFVVMYDASGVRRAAGLQAERLNALPQRSWGEQRFDRPLKSSLGHSHLEVLVGSLLGPAITVLGMTYFGSPLQMAHTLQLFVSLA